MRTGAKLIEIDTSASNDYRITKDNFDRAILKCKEMNTVPKVLILTNPNNPLGRPLETADVRNTISWCRELSMHVVFVKGANTK